MESGMGVCVENGIVRMVAMVDGMTFDARLTSEQATDLASLLILAALRVDTDGEMR